MTDEFVRKLPFSMIAEQSLLGSVLIDPQSLNDVAEIITAQDFLPDGARADLYGNARAVPCQQGDRRGHTDRHARHQGNL